MVVLLSSKYSVQLIVDGVGPTRMRRKTRMSEHARCHRVSHVEHLHQMRCYWCCALCEGQGWFLVNENENESGVLCNSIFVCMCVCVCDKINKAICG